MKKMSEKGVEKLKELEGFRSTVYMDAGNHQTIGYGHRVPASIPLTQFYTISKHVAEVFLAQDVEKAERVVNRHVIVSLTQGQFDALVSFVFNVGGGAFEESHLLIVLNDRKYDAIPDELMRWHFAHGVSVPGLVKRRLAEIALWKEA